MILSSEHFLESNVPNIATIKLEEIDFVRCFHATKLTAEQKDSVLQNGLLMPTIDWLERELKELGIEQVPQAEIEQTLEKNGRNIFVQLNQQFLIDHGDFHVMGSEKVRRILKQYPEKCPVFKQHQALKRGYVFELMLPLPSIESDSPKLIC